MKRTNMFKVIVYDKEAGCFVTEDALIKGCKPSKTRNENMERLCEILNNPLPPHEIRLNPDLGNMKQKTEDENEILQIIPAPRGLVVKYYDYAKDGAPLYTDIVTCLALVRQGRSGQKVRAITLDGTGAMEFADEISGFHSLRYLTDEELGKCIKRQRKTQND